MSIKSTGSYVKNFSTDANDPTANIQPESSDVLDIELELQKVAAEHPTVKADLYSTSSHSFGSNSELASFTLLTKDQIDRYRRIFRKLVDNDVTYNVVVTGTIAAGKSTKCDLLRELMIRVDKDLEHSCFYPEYLMHSDIGNIMLQKLHDGTVSNITFQHYIMDEFNNILRNRPLRNINLFERCPDDATFIFCRGMEKDQLDPLFKRAAQVARRYNIPTFIESIPPYYFRRIENYSPDVFNEMLSIMEADVDKIIESGQKLMHRIFGLVVTPEESYMRLRLRNRAAEGDCDLNFMRHCYNNYNDLYKYLDEHKADV